jgi:Protein of unknown function (DUF2971)
MIAKIRTAYLCCFSKARDDKTQWERYGGNGDGVCLGLRVIDEPGPDGKEVFSNLYEVVYSEQELRHWFSDWLTKFCTSVNRYLILGQTIRLGLSTLRGIAAVASITTKTPAWSSEQEVRHVAMDRKEPGLMPSVRISADGREIRYLPVSLRTDGKLIALAEIIVGSKQDFDQIREQFEALLASKDYVKGSIEYPEITFTSVSS